MKSTDLPQPKKKIRKALQAGAVIPAHPLALDSNRKLDERRQRALTRYYLAAGAGGIAVGVHTTQFAIRDAGLYEPVLALAAETVDEHLRADGKNKPVLKIAGLCGATSQASAEARTAADLGYHAGLLSLGAVKTASEDELIEHVRAVAETIPIFGFYLQPAAGGRLLGYSFWRRFAEIDNVVAIKIAPFNRYQTLDVLRGVAESGRSKKIALYTGNDDSIVADLTTPFRFSEAKKAPELRFAGGLLGHWAVWTRRAVEHWMECNRVVKNQLPVPNQILRIGVQITDANAAFFDPQHNFAGCIAGIQEVLCRQGLLEGTWLLDPKEGLSTGQAAEIDRVYEAYPHLNDDLFVRQNLHRWLR